MALGHDTPFRELSKTPARSVVGIFDQVVPSQRTTNCARSPFARVEEPTAKQLVALGQETPFSTPPDTPKPGVGMVDHNGEAPAEDANPTTKPERTAATTTSIPISSPAARPGASVRRRASRRPLADAMLTTLRRREVRNGGA